MILITPQDILYYEFYFDSFEGTPQKVTKGISSVLLSEVRFSEDLKVKDFYYHLLRDKEMIDHIFKFTTRGYKIEKYKSEFEAEPDPARDNLNHIQFNWRTTLEKKDKVKQECQFSGVGHNSDGNRTNGVESSYGIDLTPLNNLANLPLRLNHRFLIEEYSNGLTVHLAAEKEFTLMDVSNAFLYTITWNGYPEDREKAAIEIERRLEKAEKQIERGETISMEEMRKKLESMKKRITGSKTSNP
ncbi:hypothetical protein [Ekhidna sp.]|uniref:hypothetical protein n=1 Tax=Ekhidna sp. TaxID=2608089 RepID=UPI0032EFC8CB